MITLRHITLDRSPLDEWSARHRDLYLTTNNTRNKHTSMPPSGTRTHNPSRRVATDLCLRPRSYWDRQFGYVKKVKCPRYRPGVAQRVGRGIALLFHDRGTRRGWVVSSTPRPHFTTGKEPVPILQETGWAPGQVWTDGKSRPHRDSISDRPALSQSPYRLSYPAHSSAM